MDAHSEFAEDNDDDDDLWEQCQLVSWWFSGRRVAQEKMLLYAVSFITKYNYSSVITGEYRAHLHNKCMA